MHGFIPTNHTDHACREPNTVLEEENTVEMFVRPAVDANATDVLLQLVREWGEVGTNLSMIP
jgi:hypothetical protein